MGEDGTQAHMTRRGRRPIVLALLAALSLAVVLWAVLGSQEGARHVEPVMPTTPPVPTPRLFASTSPWNSVLPADAPVDPGSAQLVSALVTEVRREEEAGIGPWIATNKGTTPIYVAGPSEPVARVHLDSPSLWWRVALQRAFEAVPIPALAVPAKGSDAHMTVWQPSSDRMWEFFHMRRLGDGWHAAWGGAMDHVSENPGYYTPAAWPGALSVWGSTATSLPEPAGVITVAEFRSATIRHALSIAVPDARAGVVAFPAERSDGNGGPSPLPEGARLRLDPRLHLNRLALPPVTRMIAVAAQRYGLIVRDQTHDGISLFGEDPALSGGQAVYYGPNGILGGMTPQRLLARFPWRYLQVVEMHLSIVRPAQAP